MKNLALKITSLKKFKLPRPKPRKVTLVALFFILVLSPIIYQSLKDPQPTSAAWFNDSWLYRKKVEVTNAGSAQTDFQVSIGIGTSAPIAAGKMQSDCDDIRVTDINGKLLPHWIEKVPTANSCNQSATKIWTKVPSIETSGTTVYVYYGNPSATNTENGNTTFEYFEDFESYSSVSDLTNAGWVDISINSAQLKFTSSNGVNSTKGLWLDPEDGSGWDKAMTYYSTKTFTSGKTLDLDYYATSDNFYSGIIGFSDSTSTPTGCNNEGSNQVGVDGNCSSDATEIFHTESSDTSTKNNISYTRTSWSKLSIKWNSTSTFSVNDSQLSSSSTNIPSGSLYIHLAQFPEGTDVQEGYFDNIRVRKTAATEPSAGSPGSEEQSPGPVAYWKFDEGYGTTAYDSTKNSNSGTLGTGSSAPSWQSEDMCISGKCLQFDGSEDYVSANDGSDLDITGAMTLEAWVYLNSVTAGTRIPLISKYYAAGNQRGYMFELQSTSGATGCNNLPAFTISSTGSTFTGGARCGTTALEANKWYHIAAIFTPSTTMNIYINGVDNTGAMGTGSIPSAIFSNSQDLLIGSADDFSTKINGRIDDVKIYPYARSAAQVKTDYNARGSIKGLSTQIGGQDPQESLSQGLVGYWKMDEASWNGTADEVVDASGNGNHGVGVGATPPTTAAGKFGNGGDFDGADDYVGLGNSNSLIPSYITVAAWFKADTLPTNSSTFKGIYTRAGGYLLLAKGTGTNTVLDTWVYNGGWVNVTTTQQLSTATWYHAVLIFNGTEAKVYFNGSLIKTQSVSGTLGPSGQNTYIGADRLIADRYFDGLIDELRVYNRALSPREVRDLYNFAPGPVMHLKMDEKVSGNSQTLYDTSTNANNGTTNDGANNTGMDCTVSGKFGSGCEFDGTDDYVAVSNATELNPSYNTTIEGWFYMDTLPASGNYYVPIAKGVNNNYELRIKNSSGTTLLCGKVVDNNQGKVMDDAPSGATALSATTWYHLALTYDGTTLRSYVNGVLDRESTTSAGNTYNSSNSLYIGARGNNYTLNGVIDDVRIYNYARTAKQIVEDMNAGHPIGGSPVGSQVAYWKFDEGYGTTAQDSSPNNLDGTLVNSPSWSNNGKFGKAIQFTRSSNTYVNIPNNSALCPEDALTISGWFKRTETGYAHTILGNWWNTWGQIWVNTSDKLRWYWLESNGSTWHSLTSTSTIQTNTWYYFALTYDKSSQTAKLYLNTVLEDTETSATDIERGGCSYTYIGQDGEYPSYDGDMFNGLIDEIKFYNSALTEDEIKLDYNQGSALILGSTSTDASGNADSSSERSYCPPGDTTASCAPVAEWKFDEKTGSSAYDTSSNSNTGTLGTGSSAPEWVSGKIGAALKFDGVDDYVSVGDNNSLDFGTGNFTLSAFFKAPASAKKDYRTILAKNYNPGYWIQTNSSGNIIFGTASSIPLTSTGDLFDDTWHHVAIVREGTGTNQVKMYIDGSFDTQGTDSGSTTNALNLNIGGFVTIAARYFEGLIDHVKIYDYARTPAQIAWDYNRGAPVGWWKFDEGQGTTAYDSSGNSNNGSINIGATAPQTSAGTCTDGLSTSAWYNGCTGKYNSSLKFDGADDEVSVGDPSDLEFTDNFSISAWAKFDVVNASQAIVSKHGNSGNYGWYMWYYDTSTQLRFGTYGLSSDPCGDLVANTAPSAGQWYHFTMVYDDSSNTRYIYINGVEDKSDSCDVDISANSANFIIGNMDQTTNYLFDGQIDDVRVYNYALTATQVKNLYNQGAAVQFAPTTGSP